MNNIFKNKVVWITGASSGIGEALVYDFSERDARIILSARNEEKLNHVKGKCKGSIDNLVVLPLDLSHSSELDSKVNQAYKIFGKIDYLIHNAGIVSRDLAMNTNMNIDREIMETNYFGTVALTKSVLPSMIRDRNGHLVVISSLSGKYGVPNLSAYAASKHALHGFFDSLRTEVFKFGIKITIIVPGFINTALIEKAMNGVGAYPKKNLLVNEKGMSPKDCASKIIKAIMNKRQEVLIGKFEIYSVYLDRFFPNIFKRIIRNNPIKRLRNLFSSKN